jgi:hypothetical protein
MNIPTILALDQAFILAGSHQPCLHVGLRLLPNLGPTLRPGISRLHSTYEGFPTSSFTDRPLTPLPSYHEVEACFL